jgi:GntR family transcriptional repressor for pyruvate dehydrogenase complex
MNLNDKASGTVDEPLAPLSESRLRKPGRDAKGAPDLTASLIDRVRKMISQRHLKPGARLPTERQLAAGFAVNRASVRQALKALVAMGVLVQRVGDGTYVSPRTMDVPSLPARFSRQSETPSIAELFDVRMIVEPALVARAANHRTEADIAALESAITLMNAGLETGLMSLTVKGDLTFYERLWDAAGDRVICRMLNPIHMAICQSTKTSVPASRYKRIITSHRRILEAVRLRNGAIARETMEALLKSTRKDYVERPLVSRPRRTPQSAGTSVNSAYAG